MVLDLVIRGEVGSPIPLENQRSIVTKLWEDTEVMDHDTAKLSEMEFGGLKNAVRIKFRAKHVDFKREYAAARVHGLEKPSDHFGGIFASIQEDIFKNFLVREHFAHVAAYVDGVGTKRRCKVYIIIFGPVFHLLLVKKTQRPANGPTEA